MPGRSPQPLPNDNSTPRGDGAHDDRDRTSTARARAQGRQQGRQDSNLQPPVLETGALPIELRPWAGVGLYPRLSGIPERMTDLPTEDVDRTQQEREGDADQHRHDENQLLEEQEHKGYGEDEGERDQALPE